MWLDSPILWLACRHHVAELHIHRAIDAVTGNTTEPGVKLFRRLKDQWLELLEKIDYKNLTVLGVDTLPPSMREEAKSVLGWAQEELDKGTWPREDYRELLELLIVTLDGHVKNFSFSMPGADHHARWMSKAIYYMKMRLLKNIFALSTEEEEEVDIITEFTSVFYVMYWLQTPLSAASARHDLEFMEKMVQYRNFRPKIAFVVLQSTYRHGWYIAPQTITLALADRDLEDSTKELMAKKLHSMVRKKIDTGKPEFPLLPWGPEVTRRNMDSLVTEDSWLVFNLLGLQDTQVLLKYGVLMCCTAQCNIMHCTEMCHTGLAPHSGLHVAQLHRLPHPPGVRH
jgi:hypothetical protein